MKAENLLASALNHTTYTKGAEYSASDVIGEPLKVLLTKKYPNCNDVKPLDKIASWIGTGCHSQLEEWIEAENEFDETNMESEVKLKYKNLSGTADVILDGNIICDLKTSKESNIVRSIKNPLKWIHQLSIYNYLNHKQNGVEMSEYGYIFWISVDSRKFGTEKLKLLSKEEVTILIKEFMAQIKKPIEEQDKCSSCGWLWKWCNVRSKCEYYGSGLENSVDEW